MDIKVKALQSFVHGRLDMVKGAEQSVPEAIAKDLIKADLVVAASQDVTASKGAATDKASGAKGTGGGRKKADQSSNKESASKTQAGGLTEGSSQDDIEGGAEVGGKDDTEGGSKSDDQSEEK